MKHLGKDVFPKVWSYQIINLEKTFNNPYVNNMIDFIH